MNDKPGRELAIFDSARALPAGERAAHLLRECGDNAALRARVEALLRADAEAGAFLEAPPAGRPLRGASAIGEQPGDRIGRYRLRQQIGEGGCGVVFLAEQDEPVRRQVALKIIKPGMDTRSVIARFEVEQQVLALMDHPNIAKVFDAGATESGRPYFVMELVRGVRITDYCDRQSLATGDRLKLFVQVCQAVQHAHQKGVIHRDIKPSNILVTTTEQGVAHPIVIDFGIAKATTNQRLTDKTLFTAFEMLIGTPAYMSPEQAAVVNVDLDTRTDIYSLGVLLYEMLTGSTPFDAAKLIQAGLEEIRRVIREEEPARPSTRLSSLAAPALTTVAHHRQSKPPELIHAVRGDLDWIVMKALEKDRTRRYETANGLALDVQRCLANEPVAARPPSRLYRLQKTVQRHRLLFAGIGIVCLVLVASLVAVLAALARERRERRTAQTEEARSRLVTRFLKDTLAGVGPSVARGRDTILLREVLDRTARLIGPQAGSQPAVEAEILGIIGPLYLEIGDYATAETMARGALDLQRKLAGPRSLEAGVALHDLGQALWKQRKLAEAEASLQEALDLRRARFGPEHRDVAATLSLLGAVYRRQGRLAESESLTRESLAMRQKLFGSEHLEVADSLRNLAILLNDRGQRAEAEAAAREMLAMRRRLLGDDHPLVALALSDLAHILGGRSAEGERLELESFGIQWRVLADEHPDLVRSVYLQGERLRGRGELAEAHAVLHAALSLQRRILGEAHPDVLATIRGLTSVLEKEGQWAEAEGLHRQALDLRSKRDGPGDPQTVVEMEGIIRALREQHRLPEAERMWTTALAAASPDDPAQARLLYQRGDFMARQGRWDEAQADFASCIGHQPTDRDAYHLLAPVLAITRNRPAYTRLCHQLLNTFTNATNPYWAERTVTDCLLLPNPDVDLDHLDHLADIALNLGQGDPPAVPFFQMCKALAGYRLARYPETMVWAGRIPDTAPSSVRAQANAVLAMAHWHLGQAAEARKMLASAEALAPEIALERDRDNLSGPWVPWLIARVTIREAKDLMESPPPEPRLDRP